MQQVRVLIVDSHTLAMYGRAFCNSFREQGYSDVELFDTNDYLDIRTKQGLQNYILRLQNKFAIGPKVKEIQNALLSKVKEMKPELVFFYSTRLIHPKTVKTIKSLGCKIFMYNNDDPFASYFPKYFWRNYVGGLKYADKGFVYRQQNVEDYQKNGCADVELLRSYYIKTSNFPMENVNISVPEVVFLGHSEKDERRDYIKALMDRNIKVGVMKRSWEDFEPGNPMVVKLADSHKYYNEMLNKAKIALVFLSKINHDTYTRRCFEIPATKTLMIAPYTEDLAAMYKDGKEVVLYRNKQEFVEKVQYYLEHEEERMQIANAGYERLMCDGHEVGDRVKQVMRAYEKICEEK